MEKAIVLTSGGLDSTTVVYQLIAKGIEVYPLFLTMVSIVWRQSGQDLTK